MQIRWFQHWRRVLLVALKVALPLATLAMSVGAARWIIATRPQPPQQEIAESAPAVTAARIQRRDVRFPIRSQGTVQPRRESTLAARVSGQVEWVADCFDESGFFQQGDVLIRIDRRDYSIRVQRLEAALRSAVARQTETEQELKRLVSLRSRRAASESDLEQAKAASEMAKAAVAEVKAQLAEARHAEADTEIRAPFDGCIQEACVEVGQFVTVGTKLASCFATDAVQVRLPVSDDEFAFLGLALGASFPAASGLPVELSADFAGQRRAWSGHVVRSEAVVDARSRMVFLVVEVSDPYANTQAGGGQPLAVGMFVEGVILCPPVPDAVVLPNACVNSRGELFVVSEAGTLELRSVEVLRREREYVVVRGDLPEGGVACATRLDGAVPGMQVQVVGEVTSMAAQKTGEGNR